MTRTVGRGDPRMARQINDRVALDLLADQGPLTRTQLREITGLAQPTVIDLVRRLTDSGLIEELGQVEAVRPGPRPVLYGLRTGNHLVAAADVRDNELWATVIDVAGGPRHTLSRAQDDTPLPEQIAGLVREVIAAAGRSGETPVHTVVGLPGIIDRATGDLGFSWDLPEWRSGMLDPLRELIAGPVELVTGVRLVALAEQQFLDVPPDTQYALVWLGVGLGLTVIDNGRPYLGASGAAGQIGYMPVPGAPVPPVDRIPSAPDGFRGDFQTLAGSRALRDLGRTQYGLTSRSIKTMLTQAMRGQTPEADAFLDEVARRIAVGLAAISSVMDPGLFVLHGETGVAGGAHLAARVEAQLRDCSPLDSRVVAPRFTDWRDAALAGGLRVAKEQGRLLLWGSDGDRSPSTG
ncbi:putative NBD/HSP70 family sugar kinase [Kribbella aluminosa]|uniref:NBD/HSP70 family sugar kinase n=1 Tax=Kribbella aluminosa TaxID=416017 RepID=A0ABS4UWW4_9ACTN|nr:ROK family transcriptional regulator [Kribbella aluminosa]MBP2356121.1 putative NBD/HSP70 family sugar kinase [Kribbella aluminosa]